MVVHGVYFAYKNLSRNKLFLPAIGILAILLIFFLSARRYTGPFGKTYWISDSEIEEQLDSLFRPQHEDSAHATTNTCTCNESGDSAASTSDFTMCFGGQSLAAVGTNFDCRLLHVLNDLKIFDTQNTVSEPLDTRKIIYVTAAKHSDFTLLLRTIASAEKAQKAKSYVTKQKIIVYDLGLINNQVEKLKSICDIEVKQFQHGKYKEFLSEQLEDHQIKPIIIAEMLHQYPSGFWWMDTSVRWISNTSVNADTAVMYVQMAFGWLEPLCLAGVVLPQKTEHSIYGATNPGMYHYLPIHPKKSRKIDMFSTELMYWLRTQSSLDALKWWLLCALTPDCIAPRHAGNDCLPTYNKHKEYGQCHEFGQSALNLILSAQFVPHDYGACASNRRDVSDRNPFFELRPDDHTDTPQLQFTTCKQ